ncbi:MAG TPA: universal stress protein [Thermomicrobiales bacterium]|nr:universal stress protein [Thermomicrobiales bacterium]
MPYRRILVPVHGNDGDFRALELAGVLADKKTSDVTLVYVVEVRQSLPLDADIPQAVTAGEVALDRAEQYARQRAEHKLLRITPELLQARSAGAAIVDEAIERDIDVIVMASRNRQQMGRVTFGDTVPFILKNAPCEVILARAGLAE